LERVQELKYVIPCDKKWGLIKYQGSHFLCPAFPNFRKVEKLYESAGFTSHPMTGKSSDDYFLQKQHKKLLLIPKFSMFAFYKGL
jgi:hypothetical protein